MKQLSVIISIISVGTAAAVLAFYLPQKAKHSKQTTFAELYEDNACDLGSLFD